MYNERKDTFSIKDIIVQVLCILLFIFLLLWLFPTKSFIKNNTNNNSVNSSDGELTVKYEESEQLVDAIFNYNVQTMKETAISYYTTSRLPINIGDEKKMTLREMLNEKLLLSFLDSDGKQCDLDNSYVSITKESDEYILKVNLVCPASKSDYILVHLGCYDYCKGNVCEKQEPKKTYSCKIVNGQYWGKNKKIVDKATYEKECSPKYYCKIVNGQYWGKEGKVVDKATYEKQCTTPPTYTCKIVNGQYWGKNGKVVDKATYEKECIAPTYTCKIVDGKYWGKDGKIVDKATYEKECIAPTYTCKIVNGQYWGKNGKVVDKATYEKECTYYCQIVDGKYWGSQRTIVDKATYEKQCIEKIYEYEYVKTNPENCTWSNWSSWSRTAVSASATVQVETRTVSDGYTTSYETRYRYEDQQSRVDTATPICKNSKSTLINNNKTCQHVENSYIVTNTSCPSGYTLSGSKCVKTVRDDSKLTYKVTPGSTYWTSAVRKIYSSAQVSTSTTKYNYVSVKVGVNSCDGCKYATNYIYDVQYLKSNPDTKTITGCSDGYTLTSDKKHCEKTTTKKVTTTYTCSNSNFTYVEGLGCVRTANSICPDGYSKNSDGTKCVKTTNYCANGSYDSSTGKCKVSYQETIQTPKYATEYRYKTLTCKPGSIEYKWSRSNNDSSLFALGFKLTGNKREVK